MADCDKRVVVIYCCGLLVRAKMLLQFLLIGPSSFQVVFVEMSDIKKKRVSVRRLPRGDCGYFVETGPINHSSSSSGTPRGISQFLDAM